MKKHKLLRKIIPIIAITIILSLSVGCVSTQKQSIAIVETNPIINGANSENATLHSDEHTYKSIRHTQETRTPAEEDEYILNGLWHMATIVEDFDDNLIYLLFRHDYEGEIGFDYFQDIPIPTKVIEISDFRETKKLHVGDHDTIPMKDQRVKSLFLTLSTHDKQIVLDMIVWLMSENEVLTAEPFGHGDVNSCTVPTDPYYSAQSGMTGAYGINIEPLWSATTGSSNIDVLILENTTL